MTCRLATGASAGIGAKTARARARRVRGVKLVLAARRTPELEALAAERRAGGAACAVVPADLAAPRGADALAEAATAAFGGVDVLVNDDIVARSGGRFVVPGLPSATRSASS